MTLRDKGLNLTAAEIAEAFADPEWNRRYPPVLSVLQAAELLQVPVSTLYSWSSQGRLKGCGRRIGRHLRLFRNRLLTCLLNGGFNDAEK
jgi:excisionase family DNA binding protein